MMVHALPGTTDIYLSDVPIDSVRTEINYTTATLHKGSYVQVCYVRQQT